MKTTKKTGGGGKIKGGGDTADAKDKILEYIYDMHDLGHKEVAEDGVLTASGYSRTDSTGYRVIMKNLKDNDIAVRKSKMLYLTEKGRQLMDKKMEGRPKVKRTNKGLEEQFKEKILKTTQKLPASKLDIAWDVLRDRQGHSQEELLEAMGYARSDSTGYKVTMKALKERGLVVKNGKHFSFVVEKVFPYPEEDDAE